MPTTDTTLVVEFAVDKETPGTIRFAEVTDEERGKVGTLYLRKDVAESLGKPERILVRIEAA